MLCQCCCHFKYYGNPVLAATGDNFAARVSLQGVFSFCVFPILPIGQLLLLLAFHLTAGAMLVLGLILSLSAHSVIDLYDIWGKRAAEEGGKHGLKLSWKNHYDAVERRREELDMMRRDFSKG